MAQYQTATATDLQTTPLAVQIAPASPAADRAESDQWPRQGEWTYQDWLRLPDDGWRYEVIEGVLHMNPAPTTTHQRISRDLG